MTRRDVRQTVGDSAEHAWLQEFMDRCFPEHGGQVAADLQLAMAMCKAEPKSAQYAMQHLAQDLRAASLDAEALAFVRFALGVLALAYVGLAQAEGRVGPGELPRELETPIRWNPEIVECLNALPPLGDS